MILSGNSTNYFEGNTHDGVYLHPGTKFTISGASVNEFVGGQRAVDENGEFIIEGGTNTFRYSANSSPEWPLIFFASITKPSLSITGGDNTFIADESHFVFGLLANETGKATGKLSITGGTNSLTGKAGLSDVDDVTFENLQVKGYPGATVTTAGIKDRDGNLLSLAVLTTVYNINYERGSCGDVEAPESVSVPAAAQATFDDDGKASYTIDVATPSWTGYQFNGWSVEGSEELKQPGTTINITDDLTLTADWTANTGVPYTVIHQQQKLDGSYETVDTDHPTGSTGEVVTPAVKSYEGFTPPTTENLTILADGTASLTYQYSRNSYVVTVTKVEGVESVSGVDAETGSKSYQYGASVELSASPEEGYQSVTWSGDKESGSFTMPAQDVSLNVSGEKNTYLVTFKPEGGSDVDSQNVKYGDKVSKPAAPTRDGYIFKEWQHDRRPYDFDTPVTGNLELTAVWTEEPKPEVIPEVDKQAGEYGIIDLLKEAGIDVSTIDDSTIFTLDSALAEISGTGKNARLNCLKNGTLMIRYRGTDGTDYALSVTIRGAKDDKPDQKDKSDDKKKDKSNDKKEKTLLEKLKEALAAEPAHICKESDYAWDVHEGTETEDGYMEYKCRECGTVKYSVPISAYYNFNKNVADKIRNAKAGQSVKVDTPIFVSFHEMVKDAIAANPNAEVVISYKYNGKFYEMTIPAGTTKEQLDTLWNGTKFCGFRNMASVFATTEK